MRNWHILVSEIINIFIIVVLAVDVIKAKKIKKTEEVDSLTPSLIAMSIIQIPALFVTIYCIIKSSSSLLQSITVLCSLIIAFIYVLYYEYKKKRKH